MRISVVGRPGSGKSTLAERISLAFAIPLIELDAINWQRVGAISIITIRRSSNGAFPRPSLLTLG
jgi:adenylate kinase family enzyme